MNRVEHLTLDLLDGVLDASGLGELERLLAEDETARAAHVALCEQEAALRGFRSGVDVRGQAMVRLLDALRQAARETMPDPYRPFDVVVDPNAGLSQPGVPPAAGAFAADEQVGPIPAPPPPKLPGVPLPPSPPSLATPPLPSADSGTLGEPAGGIPAPPPPRLPGGSVPTSPAGQGSLPGAWSASDAPVGERVGPIPAPPPPKLPGGSVPAGPPSARRLVPQAKSPRRRCPSSPRRRPRWIHPPCRRRVHPMTRPHLPPWGYRVCRRRPHSLLLRCCCRCLCRCHRPRSRLLPHRPQGRLPLCRSAHPRWRVLGRPSRRRPSSCRARRRPLTGPHRRSRSLLRRRRPPKGSSGRLVPA